MPFQANAGTIRFLGGILQGGGIRNDGASIREMPQGDGVTNGDVESSPGVFVHLQRQRQYLCRVLRHFHRLSTRMIAVPHITSRDRFAKKVVIVRAAVHGGLQNAFLIRSRDGIDRIKIFSGYRMHNCCVHGLHPRLIIMPREEKLCKVFLNEKYIGEGRFAGSVCAGNL